MWRTGSKSSIQRFVITEKAPTRAFSWLKAATTPFTLKTLLRHRDTESVKDIYSIFKDFFNEPSPANGCNKMNCECGVTMCYLCRMIVPNNYDHFIGPGGSPSDGICPLYSDMNTLHRDEINNAALEAKNELENNNVTLKWDP